MKEPIDFKVIYNLLDDCHTELAKSGMDSKKYAEISLRIIEAKQEIMKLITGRYLLDFLQWFFTQPEFQNTPIIEMVEKYLKSNN